VTRDTESPTTPSAPGSGFADRLDAAIRDKKSCLVVGLDPDLERLPGEVFGRSGRLDPSAPGWTGHASVAIATWLEGVIEAVAPHAAAVKPNAGFFERFGAAGWECLRRGCEIARRQGLEVVVDAKRGDIGNTAKAYADALLGDAPDTIGPVCDAVTLNPWLGRDSVEPFLDRVREAGKGAFFLVRTSNPSARDIQELEVDGEPVYVHVARLVASWGEGLDGDCGLNPVGAVVGATAPEQAARVRAEMPKAMFLVPGYGAQGATAADLAPFFLPGGRGVIVNASRSILYAHDKNRDVPWQQAVGEAARAAQEDLESVRASV